MRVLIVGAGPTGLTAAVELARRGVHAEIIDRKDEASTLSRAVGINPRSLELLEPSGVSSRLLELGVIYRKVRLYRDDNLLLDLPLATARVQHGYGFLLGLPQDETEGVLRDAFVRLGGRIEYGTRLVGVRQEDDRVIAETAAGDELPFDYLIGADGARSTTRKALGLDFAGFDIAEQWSIADVDAEGWPHPDAFTACQLPRGGVAAVAPLGKGRYRVISNLRSPLEALPLPLEATRIRREGAFTISVRQVRDYRKGRVFLAGDAAHCHSPVGGRGMNLGIADGAELAARFSTGELSGYSDQRHREGANVIADSERFRKVLTSPNPATRALFRSALKMASLMPPLQRRIAQEILYG